MSTVPPGGPGCNPAMPHYAGPPGAPLARMFDPAGHPPNCPAHTPDGEREARPPAHPGDSKSRESASRTQQEQARAARVAAALRAEIDRQQAAAAETPEERARRLDAERDAAGRTYRAAVHAADQAWRAIGGRP